MVPEAGVGRVIGLPWVSFASDAPSVAAEGAALLEKEHPRAYGIFARVLGHYVRDERALTLADAVHRMSGLPTRSEEHTSELQSLMRISYAVFCLKKKKN